jgi:hypothetical protein
LVKKKPRSTLNQTAAIAVGKHGGGQLDGELSGSQARKLKHHRHCVAAAGNR